MAQILTFLGKGGSGRTTMAIAAAKKIAQAGDRVLLVGQDPGPAFGLLLEFSPTFEPQELVNNLQVVQLKTSVLLEQSWEEVKAIEKEYLRSPTLKNVYGQELGILPGMDQALALNALREYEKSGKYDVIIYDGPGNINSLRMLGIPEILSWYIRRFRKVIVDSDVGKALSPFVTPVTSAIMNVSWSPDWGSDNVTSGPTNKANEMLEEGKNAVADPQRVVSYLLTTEEETAIATAKYLWGSAQQIGLSVAGLLVNQGSVTEAMATDFSPLPLHAIPSRNVPDWQNVIDALPDLRATTGVTKSIIIDVAARQIKVYLPGFDKKQVKLTQYGPEITIEAGDQRRNIILPPSLSGQSVKGAKFNNNYLNISL